MRTPIVTILAVIAACTARTLSGAEAPQAVSLFDGASLAAWEGTPGRWTIEDNAITGSIAEGETLATNEFLYWKDEAADFELDFDYRLSGGPQANSGFQIRS